MKTFTIKLTKQEIFEISHCLNKEAKHFREMANVREMANDETSSIRKTPEYTIGIWKAHADKLNALTCKLIESQRT